MKFIALLLIFAPLTPAFAASASTATCQDVVKQNATKYAAGAASKGLPLHMKTTGLPAPILNSALGFTAKFYDLGKKVCSDAATASKRSGEFLGNSVKSLQAGDTQCGSFKLLHQQLQGVINRLKAPITEMNRFILKTPGATMDQYYSHRNKLQSWPENRQGADVNALLGEMTKYYTGKNPGYAGDVYQAVWAERKKTCRLYSDLLENEGSLKARMANCGGAQWDTVTITHTNTTISTAPPEQEFDHNRYIPTTSTATSMSTKLFDPKAIDPKAGGYSDICGDL